MRCCACECYDVTNARSVTHRPTAIDRQDFGSFFGSRATLRTATTAEERTRCSACDQDQGLERSRLRHLTQNWCAARPVRRVKALPEVVVAPRSQAGEAEGSARDRAGAPEGKVLVSSAALLASRLAAGLACAPPLPVVHLSRAAAPPIVRETVPGRGRPLGRKGCSECKALPGSLERVDAS